MRATTLDSGLRVTPMSEEGGFVVAGTQDPDAAREAARAYFRQESAEDGWDGEELEERLGLIDRCVPRIGLYRWTPCHPSSCFDGGGHSGHLGYADTPGRGVFRGVYLQGPW